MASALTKPGNAGRLEQRSKQATVAVFAQRIRDAVAEQAARALAKSGMQTMSMEIGKRTRQAKAPPLVIHGRPKVLQDPMFYPPHDERRETAAYKKVRKGLVEAEDRPCLVCGVRFSFLKDKSKVNDPDFNPYGAKQMETHHHVIEWALANAIDIGKFNKSLRPNLAARHPENEDYKTDMTAAQVRDWVDHSPDNLWVLCDVHHRHRWVGIHEISYPLWVPQDLVTPEFIEEVRKATAADDSKLPSTRASTKSRSGVPGAKTIAAGTRQSSTR